MPKIYQLVDTEDLGYDDTTFAGRMFIVYTRWMAAEWGEGSYALLGRLVGNGKGKALERSTIKRWFEGAKPDIDTIARLAKVVNVDPGWLAFGPESAAPMVRHRQRKSAVDRKDEQLMESLHQDESAEDSPSVATHVAQAS